MFPWKEYTASDLSQGYVQLMKSIDKNEPTFPRSYPFVGMGCSNRFFQYERYATRGLKGLSPTEFWRTRLSHVQTAYKTYKARGNSNTLQQFMGYYFKPPSQFPPVIAGLVYKLFGVQSVLDPYAGWGDRCIAAMASGVDYIGIDSNPHLVEPYREMIAYYPHKSRVRFISGQSEDVNLDRKKFDLVFSSPPFFKEGKLLELYSGTRDNYDEFMRKSLIPVTRRCLAMNVPVAFHLPPGMYADLSEAVRPCQMRLKFSRGSALGNNVNVIYCWIP